MIRPCRPDEESSGGIVGAMPKTKVFTGLVIIAVLAAACQEPSQSLKLYVFDCGTLKSGNPAPLLERGVKTTDMSVAAYLIVHPRGTLLWDTGVIPDELVQAGETTFLRATVHR